MTQPESERNDDSTRRTPPESENFNPPSEATGQPEFDAGLEATQSFSKSHDDHKISQEQAHRLHCPHCGNLIQIVGQVSDEVTCKNCGSSFHLDFSGDSSTTGHSQLRRIGQFEIVSVLGRGGFGIVYKALDPDLNRFVAVKVPRSGYFATGEEQERFYREARHAAQLQHPGIVRVYEVARESNVPYIVSEYIDGLTLADMMTGRRFSHREVAELIVQVAEALHYAHSLRVIHRDIKPSNILLDHAHRPYIADFGLARWDDAEMTITRRGEVLGTPSYMSPEQASGDSRQIDARSDVYSLGVVLYQLFTGELPFRGSRRMLIHQLLTENPKLLRSINDTVPRDLETITLRAMAKEPARRFPSAQALADDLRRWLRHEPIVSRPVSSLERAFRWGRRHPLTASLLAIVSCLTFTTLLVLGLWAIRERAHSRVIEMALQSEQAQRQRADENAKAERRRLAQHLEAQGIVAMQSNEPLSALPWFVEALSLQAGDPQRERLHRLRLGMIQRLSPTLISVNGFPTEVRIAVVSADGKRIGVGGRDGSVSVLAADGSQVSTSPQPHAQTVTALAFSPDGSQLASGSGDNTVRLWTIDATPPQVAVLRHDHSVRDIAFHPDGKTLAVAALNSMVRLWESQSGMPKGNPLRFGAGAMKVEFSPDGARLAAVHSHGAEIRQSVVLWDFASEKIVGEPFSDSTLNFITQFSPDSQRLVFGGGSGLVHVVDAVTGKPIDSLPRSVSVSDLAFSRDGAVFAVADQSGRVQIYDSHSLKAAELEILHSGPVSKISFSSSGGLIAISGTDGVTQVCSRETAQLKSVNLRQSAHVCATSFLNDDRTLMTASGDGTVKLWNMETIESREQPPSHEQAIFRVQIGDKGERLATSSQDGTAKLWNGSGTQLIAVLQHDKPVTLAVFSADESLVVTGSLDGTARIWRASDGASLAVPLAHPGPVTSVAIHPNSKIVATACADGQARLWDAATGRMMSAMSHSDSIPSLAFHPSGEFLATWSEDRTARVWRVADGQPASPPLAHTGGVISGAFSVDGKWLATTGHDSKTIVWDWQKAIPAGQLPLHLGEGRRVSFHPRSNHLLSIGVDDRAFVWDVDQGRTQATNLVRANGRLLNGEFNRDGSMAVIVGENSGQRNLTTFLGEGFAIVYDPMDGVPLSPPMRHRHSVSDAVFSVDGRQLMTVTRGGEMRSWPLEPDSRSIDELRLWSGAASGRVLDSAMRMIPLPAVEQAASLSKLTQPEISLVSITKK